MRRLAEHGSQHDVIPRSPNDLDAVGLDELLQLAELQTRRDRKYVVPTFDANRLTSCLPTGTRVLTIDGNDSFRYESVYFDTPDHTSYRLAARRRPRRFKVRTRTYVDSDTCVLEVKVRDARGNTVKHRRPHDPRSTRQLDPDALGFAAEFEQVAVTACVDQLAAALVTSYRRTTLLVDDDSSRVTLDVDLEWSVPDDGSTSLDDVVLIETKTTGRPSSIDRILWSMGHRPTTISKYCTGLAALTPGLPANKWHRVLNRWFADQPPSVHS